MLDEHAIPTNKRVWICFMSLHKLSTFKLCRPFLLCYYHATPCHYTDTLDLHLNECFLLFLNVKSMPFS